jgi:hypothetical protein
MKHLLYLPKILGSLASHFSQTESKRLSKVFFVLLLLIIAMPIEARAQQSVPYNVNYLAGQGLPSGWIAPSCTFYNNYWCFDTGYAILPQFNVSLGSLQLEIDLMPWPYDGETVHIGYVTDPNNMSTFTELQSFESFSAWLGYQTHRISFYGAPSNARIAIIFVDKWLISNVRVAENPAPIGVPYTANLQEGLPEGWLDNSYYHYAQNDSDYYYFESGCAVMPEFSSSLNLSTLLLDIELRPNNAFGHAMQMGYLTNPNDLNTFTALETFTYRASWTSYRINRLSLYGVPNGARIAFVFDGPWRVSEVKVYNRPSPIPIPYTAYLQTGLPEKWLANNYVHYHNTGGSDFCYFTTGTAALPAINHHTNLLQLELRVQPHSTEASAEYMQAGYLSRPYDMSSFVPLQTFYRTSAWDSYQTRIVSFRGVPINATIAMRFEGDWMVDKVEVCQPSPVDIPYHADCGSGLPPGWMSSNIIYSNYQWFFTTGWTILPKFNADLNTLLMDIGLMPDPNNASSVHVGYVTDPNNISTFTWLQSFESSSSWNSYQYKEIPFIGAPDDARIAIYFDGDWVISTVDVTQPTPPYEQNFTNSFLSAGWNRYEGIPQWSNGVATATLTPSGSGWTSGQANGVFDKHAFVTIGQNQKGYWLVTPFFYLDDNYALSFDYAVTKYSGNAPLTSGAQPYEKFAVLISDDNGATWHILKRWDNTGSYASFDGISNTGKILGVDLSNYTGEMVKFAFYAESGNGDATNRVHIDNFSLDTYDPSTPPTVTLDEVSGHTATVIWTPAYAWQQGWDFYYKSEYDGLVPYDNTSLADLQATGRFHHLTGTTYALQNLIANTYYQVWVRHRNGSETGSWSSPLGFTTTSQCAPPKNPQVETTQTTATITWEPGQPNQTSWNIWVDPYHDMEGDSITSPSFTMTNLTPGREFVAEIYGYCGGDDGNSESIYVEFSTDDYDHLTVNEGDETNENVVIMGDYCCMSNPMSQTQFVIPADMLTDMQYSTIKKLSFYSESDSEEWDDASFQIFITEVNTSDFVNKCEANTVDFVNWNYMTQFYNGTLSIEHHVMTITPSFGGGFYYINGNLVVGIRQNQTGDCHQGLEWHGVNTNTTQALYNTQLAGVQCEEFLPQVTFAYEPDPYKPPTEFIAYAQGSNEVFFWWEQVDGAISYDIEVSWSPDFDEAEDQLLGDLPDYFFVWDDYEYLEPNSSYYARIRSHFVVNGTDHFSSWSEGVEFTTLSPCPAPTNLTVEVIDNLTVELDWTENGDATEWGIAYAAAGENELGFATYHHPYVLGAPYLEPGKTYTVRVRPICEGEVFAWSNTVTFNTNNIVFEDQNVKALCVASSTGWDANGDGELSYTEAAAVTTLGEVFKNNDDITTFNELQYFTGLTSIVDHAFGGCGNLTSVVIPVGVTSIGTSAFSYCPNLTTVIVPEGLTTIGSYAFMYDTHLTDFVFPESLRIIGAQTFDHCSSLTYLFIPASVISIPSHAFLGCSGLEYVSVAPGNTIYDSRDDCNAIIETSSNQLRVGCKTTMIPNTVTSIGTHAFRENTALTSIDLPESITAINDYAFLQCSGLNAITLPSSVTTIGKRAFRDCTGLQSITVEAAIPPSIFTGEDDSFYGVDKAIPVYVLCDYMTDYYDINGTGTWGGFTNFIAIDCPQQSQVIALHEGWNWWAPKGEMYFADLGDILDQGRGLIVLSQDEGFARFEDDLWQGTLSEFVPGKMYQIMANEDCTIVVTSMPVSYATVTIKPNFNWIGYTGPAGLSIAEALGSFEPNEGDEIHDEDGVRMASYDGENWGGNLLQLVPGKGYLYYSTATVSKTIIINH